ncbi:hypothetical protein BUALT_Bualt07G0062800 [Buddleja alternifolia]|uniref:Uncharacterized protein n=1 Tax=Buddleja alternifolia TaxID=168488 RepID=A0AAV6XJE0_9LAMI|nr:hypothetical protein BUALT_Bualt07G0062800 [Buddleja alternifolia]
MATIEVVSSCVVGMANKGVELSNSKMNLTPWDLKFLLLDPIQKGIFFHKPCESQEFENTIIHQLKTSLSRTLDLFPPLAGRLGTVKNTNNMTSYFIDCNNSGVEFTYAIARAVTMSNILESTYIPNMVSCFFNGSSNYEGISKPLLVVDGFFIGRTANHSIVDAGTHKISTLQALSAHLWQSVVRSRRQNTCNLNDQEVQFIILVDARARIVLPGGYFGNAAYGARTASSEHELLSHGLGYAALKVNELVDRQTREAAIKVVEDWVSNAIILERGSTNFVMASSPRHNVYGNDFGWGKPIAVRSGKGQNFDGRMTVLPAAGLDGGIDVEVCLAQETMHGMEDDALFMEVVAS